MLSAREGEKGGFSLKSVRNLAGFDPTHKPWLMDHPHGLSDK